MDHIFVDLHVVAALGQRVELEAKFMLGGGDFVMVLFRLDAHVAHDGQHLAAHVLLGIDRRHGEIAALDRRDGGRDCPAHIRCRCCRRLPCSRRNRSPCSCRHRNAHRRTRRIRLPDRNRWCRRCPRNSHRPRPPWRWSAGSGHSAGRWWARCTSQTRISVVWAKKGSITAVSRSGISSMSDSLIAFQPAIEEPSNMVP